MNELDRIRASSQYLSTLLRRPELKDWLWDQKNLYRRYPLIALYEDLLETVGKPRTFADLQLDYRKFKQRHFLRIGGRDLLGWADLAETTAQVSDLACVALQAAVNILGDHPHWWLGEDVREKWIALRRDLQLVIMGLGKLGGNELNFVSDIDLLFLHDVHGDAQANSIEYRLMLSTLCQWLSRLMADKVEGDSVFLVDFRLRPRGKDGELAPSFACAADYYLHHGHAWERQMLLKARPVAGERSLGTAFLREVRPFVFRRFLDFQALDEIRSMRDRILKEAIHPRPGWQQFDVKLGVGGIREVEFVVQCLQLIYGGRHPELDEPNTLRCLERLGELKLLPLKAVSELREAYTFLRCVEHWVQLDQNRQTQKLPQSADARLRLFMALGFDGDERRFLDKLDASTATVHQHFLALFHQESRPKIVAPVPGQPGKSLDERFNDLDMGPSETLERLREHLKAFPSFLQSEVLDTLESFSSLKDPELLEKVPVRLERYFSQVRRRPGLVKAFDSPMAWTKDLCRALVQSQLVADLLSHQPSLVEGLLNSPVVCPPAGAWEAIGKRLLSSHEDFEEAIEWIRRLKNERLLQIALADLDGVISHEIVESYLTSLADFVIQNTYERILKKVELPPDAPVAVIALGKLGSKEMGYLSDLDLVFVYQPAPDDPNDEIPSEVVRMIQRFMRMLSTPLQEGPGYSVDARLRPTGNYGPLIVTRGAWLEYYSRQADLWEIQALTRMRCVAGHADLCRRLEEKARDVCYRERDASAVWSRLCHLRQRMQRERCQETSDTLDIKLGMGGLADIEFAVQGNLLVHGHKDQSLQVPSIRDALKGALEQLSEVPIPLHDLQAAFENLRSLEHRLRLYLNLGPSRLSTGQFASLRTMALWPPLQGNGWVESWQDILRVRRQVRTVLTHWCPDL